MIVIPVAAVMTAGIGAGAFAVGLIAAQDVPEAVTQDTNFFVSMDGNQEFSPGGVAGAGDLDGSGSANVTIDTATDQVCVNVGFFQVDDIQLMHIHRGAAGVNGPVVVDFAPTPGPGPFNICVTSTDALTNEIAGNPLGFYLNAHTVPFPAGAVRGQLQPQPFGIQTLPSPVRVYDSRVPNSLGTPALESNSTTTVDLTPPGVASLPPGATAALVNITATDVRAAGFATVYSNLLLAPPDTSTINWSGHDVAVTTVVKVDPATGNVKVTIGPDGGTDLIIDVLGYLGGFGGGQSGN
jgi:hypothetical protein